MGDPRQAAEIDVVGAGDSGQGPAQALAQSAVLFEPVAEPLDRGAGGSEQAGGLGIVVEAGLELVEAVAECLDQGPAPVQILQQVILEVGVAGHHPHVPQDLEEHAGRAPRAAGPTQGLDQAPHLASRESG